MRNNASRGSAMPETAIVMSAVLIIFLGMIKVADVGYQQSETDAAAFVAAHEGSFGSTTTNQQSYGQTTAQNVFKTGGKTHFPGTPGTGTISVQGLSGSSSMPNPTGDVVAYANHNSGGLMLNQAFGSSFFNLHSFFIEPAAGPQYIAGSPSFSVVHANPPNCTTNNAATTSCPDLKGTFATPNPSNTADPFYGYACRALYYAVLSNGSGLAPAGGSESVYFAPQTQDLFTQVPGSNWNYVLPDSASLSGLTAGNGSLVTNEPWPLDFQPNYTGPGNSINVASVRSSGTWLSTQYEPGGTVPDPANEDGLAVGGTIGSTSALAPIFNFGSGGSSSC